MKLQEVPTVLGIREFNFPIEEGVDVQLTAVFHSKVTACTPDHRPLTSVVESLYVQTEKDLRLLWQHIKIQDTLTTASSLIARQPSGILQIQ